MVKDRKSPIILLILLFSFLAITFLLKKPEISTKETSTTTLPQCRFDEETQKCVGSCGEGFECRISPLAVLPPVCECFPTTTTTTHAELPASKCSGTNSRVCSYGFKYDCLISKCCYWDSNLSKCKPRPCSEIETNYCISCGCILSQ